MITLSLCYGEGSSGNYFYFTPELEERMTIQVNDLPEDSDDTLQEVIKELKRLRAQARIFGNMMVNIEDLERDIKELEDRLAFLENMVKE